MAFEIKFTDYIEEEYPAYEGIIVLGEFSEGFISPIKYWSKEQYESFWITQIKKTINGSNSILITEILDPSESVCIFSWPMYRLDKNVVIQNRLLFYDQMVEPFEINKIDDYIGELRTEDEDGEKISSWTVSLDEIVEFYNSISKSTK